MSIGSAVIRPLKNALDDMPVHVRQLSEMFRKHGQKQNRNTNRVDDLDGTNVPAALRDGWRKDSPHTPDRIVGTDKPHRPDPAEYLDADYIQQHLQRFEGGATRFYRQESLERWGPGNQGTTFVFPTSEIDDIIADAGGDPKKLGVMLGLGEDFFVDANGSAVPIMRADFSPQELRAGDLRMPTGNEGGAVQQWIPGGYLPEGIPETVFNTPAAATGADYSVGGTFGRWSEFEL